MNEPTGRHRTADALLDAVDAILSSEGASGLSLRQVEAEAGATHGSVRYHFGSLEGLLAAAFGRQNDEMVKRQVEVYRTAIPTLEKWRLGARVFFDADVESGWSRRIFEANRMAIDHPELRVVLQPQLRAWSELLLEAVDTAVREFGVELTESQKRGVAMTVFYSQGGAVGYALQGGHPWHEDYLDVWDALIVALGERRASSDEE